MSKKSRQRFGNALIDIINRAEPVCHTEAISVMELENPSTDLTIDDIVNTNDLNYERAGDLFTQLLNILMTPLATPIKTILSITNCWID